MNSFDIDIWEKIKQLDNNTQKRIMWISWLYFISGSTIGFIIGYGFQNV